MSGEEPTKLKFHEKLMFQKKKTLPKQASIRSNYSLVSLSDVTEKSLEVWQGLPDEIRKDPTLAAFKKKHEGIHGPTVAAVPESPTDQFSSDDDGKDPNTEFISMKVNGDNIENNEKLQEMEQMCTSIEQMNDNIPGRHKENKYVKWSKLTILLICWTLFTWFLMSRNEKTVPIRTIAISEGNVRSFALNELPINPRMKFLFQGTFQTDHYDNNSTNFMYFYLSMDNNGTSRNVSQLYKLPVVQLADFDVVNEIKRTQTVPLDEIDFNSLHQTDSGLIMNLLTNFNESFGIKFGYDPSPLDKGVGIFLATIILLKLYVLIIWELVHRTLAAIIASTLAVGILAAMNERPPMATIISWIDVETLLLLFGMMILVAILSETGAFDYLAVYAFKITNGKVWPLIGCLCLFTAILSSFLDNVTTILLMTPVTIRLCEVMELNPVPVLMFAVIYSNIGGALTPVGDPPNVIIASNSYISSNGINFANFMVHMTIPIILVSIQTYYQIRHKFKHVSDLRFNEPKEVQAMRHEIAIWQRAANALSPLSKDEDIVRQSLIKKVNRLSNALKKKIETGSVPKESYRATLGELQAKYPIKNMSLLIKSGITLVFVISFFFLHSVPDLQRLSLGWTALLGAVLLLILYDREDLEAVLHHVEWSTLVFFAALFVLMEALAELGLIEFIGDLTENLILSVGESARLAVAILIILWVSALASAFVDNIPLTTMMVKIVISLCENEQLGLPLQPLVWALALGACLGGNGTLIGASANVVCAGVAEQHGYKFTFVEFFKVGFPVMIGSIIVSTVYLMVAHVMFAWH